MRMRGYVERSQTILRREKKNEVARKLLLLKYDLITQFCTDMVNDFAIFVLRIQYSRTLNSFLNIIGHAPTSLPFTFGSFDPDSLTSGSFSVKASPPSNVGPSSGSPQSSPFKSKASGNSKAVFGTPKVTAQTPFKRLLVEGTVVNLWYIPHVREVC
jgi:hypothetical protein